MLLESNDGSEVNGNSVGLAVGTDVGGIRAVGLLLGLLGSSVGVNVGLDRALVGTEDGADGRTVGM